MLTSRRELAVDDVLPLQTVELRRVRPHAIRQQVAVGFVSGSGIRDDRLQVKMCPLVLVKNIGSVSFLDNPYFLR